MSVCKRLHVLAYSDGFTLWYYASDGDDVFVAGYFDEGAGMLRVGDMILVPQTPAIVRVVCRDEDSVAVRAM